VLAIEVDVVHAEALQRRLVAADPVERAVLAAHVADRRRDDDAVAAVGDRPADELLVGERAVHVGRVEERDPELERPVDRPDRLGRLYDGRETAP